MRWFVSAGGNRNCTVHGEYWIPGRADIERLGKVALRTPRSLPPVLHSVVQAVAAAQIGLYQAALAELHGALLACAREDAVACPSQEALVRRAALAVLGHLAASLPHDELPGALRWAQDQMASHNLALASRGPGGQASAHWDATRSEGLRAHIRRSLGPGGHAQ